MKRTSAGTRVRSIRLLSVLVALCLPAAPACAIDLFEIFVTATDGSPVPDLQVGGSELPELLD